MTHSVGQSVLGGVDHGHVVVLDGSAELPREVLGNKGYGINMMRRHGLPVPPAFCLTTNMCAEFLAEGERCLDRIWNEVQDKLARASGRADALAKDPRPDAEKVEDLFLLAVGKKPTPEQLKTALAHIEKDAKAKKQAYENIIWALLNSKAFLFNQ